MSIIKTYLCLVSKFILGVPSDTVLLEVLHITAEEIGQDWKELAEGLGTIEKDMAKLSQLSTNIDKMKESFKLKCNNISWKLLKRLLNRLGRSDIISRIVKETNLTESK